MDSLEDRDALISIRTQMMGGIFNRKVTDEMVSVFKRVLGRFPMSVLSKAFSEAESDLERFPTPKMMRALCAEKMPAGFWENQTRGCEKCQFTGWRLIPHPGASPETKKMGGMSAIACACQKAITGEP